MVPVDVVNLAEQRGIVSLGLEVDVRNEDVRMVICFAVPQDGQGELPFGNLV